MLAFGCGGSSSGPGKETRSPGEIVFRSSCQTCHSLPRPKMKNDDEWPALVRRYGLRAKLTNDQIAAITAYLTASN
jgi:cytochrome c5